MVQVPEKSGLPWVGAAAGRSNVRVKMLNKVRFMASSEIRRVESVGSGGAAPKRLANTSPDDQVLSKAGGRQALPIAPTSCELRHNSRPMPRTVLVAGLIAISVAAAAPSSQSRSTGAVPFRTLEAGIPEMRAA